MMVRMHADFFEKIGKKSSIYRQIVDILAIYRWFFWKKYGPRREFPVAIFLQNIGQFPIFRRFCLFFTDFCPNRLSVVNISSVPANNRFFDDIWIEKTEFLVPDYNVIYKFNRYKKNYKYFFFTKVRVSF